MIFRETPNGGVHVEPQKNAFIVEIRPAAPVFPVVIGLIEHYRGIGSVLQRSPAAARLVIEECGQTMCEFFVHLFQVVQAAPRGQHFAPIFRQALVDPQQVVAHRLVIIGGRQIFRPAKFAVPGMHEFVREQDRRSTVR